MIERTEHPACAAFEPLLAAYVDGEMPVDQVAGLERHLERCACCRRSVECQRATSRLVNTRRDGLGACAPAELRKRCLACAWTAPAAHLSRPHQFVRRAWLPLSFAATVLLAVAAVFLLGNLSPESLGAQFALDHYKCFQFAPAHTAVDPEAAGAAWTRTYGWPVTVPRSERAEQLELLDVRRCLSTEGSTAHILYRWRGKPLSLYVLNSASPDDPGGEHAVSRLGKEAIVWTAAGQTYAVLADGTPADLQRVVRYVQTSAHIMPGERVR
jgi:anti-sigma factor RsiW